VAERTQAALSMNTARATFSSAARLLRPSEYVAALKGRRVARGALFVVSTPKGGASSTQPRLGLIIGKKQAKRAVTRNTIKRIIRESFRLQQSTLPNRDIVFRLHARIEPCTLTALKKQVRLEADTLLKQVTKC
tara:strand:- start:28127 stop:28528 length:402 start_codon:yes stop_codon:yes gene_type:complete